MKHFNELIEAQTHVAQNLRDNQGCVSPVEEVYGLNGSYIALTPEEADELYKAGIPLIITSPEDDATLDNLIASEDYLNEE